MKHFGKKVPYKEWTFDSIKERDFFIRFIETSGKRFDVHPNFKLVEKFRVGGRNQRGIGYAPDFVVYAHDSSIEHVYDVKSGINQRAVDTAAKLRFKLFALKTGLPVEVVVPRKHDFKMKLYGFTTTFQDVHIRKNRKGKVVKQSYDIFKTIDYDVYELIGK